MLFSVVTSKCLFRETTTVFCTIFQNGGQKTGSSFKTGTTACMTMVSETKYGFSDMLFSMVTL